MSEKLISYEDLVTYTDYVEKKNVQVTRTQYTALPSSKLTDGKSYYITDEGIVIKNGVSYGVATGEVNVQSDQNVTDTTSDAYIKNKPTKVSDFTNDSGFITNTVNNLTNYYTTSNTYTKTEVDNLISAAKMGRFEVVSSLPTTDIKTNVIYLVPNSDPGTGNIKDEYINLDGTTTGWEKIGSADVDLSGYYTSSEVDDLLDTLEGTLQSNFQDGVDDVYDAVVAKGSTPASHSLADVVTGIGAIPNSNSGTYTATTRSSDIDMGATNTYRYVDTSGVPNSNSGTYDVTSNGLKDMGATNDKRYVNVSVANTNTSTYTFPANDTGATKDLGATNDTRYAVATNVYTKGQNDGKADHSTTYTPTSRASNNDMGASHSYRYVNTNSVPNNNSGTYDVTSNGVKDMGATNDKRYANINVPNSNSGTYTFAANDTGGIKDMGAANSTRYAVATNVYTKGWNDGKADHSTTYTASSRSAALDMGASHSYRYVNTNSVPNTSSGTYGSVTTNGTHDMGATNSYRYVTVNVPHPTHTTTYTPTTRASNCDMGATHSYRYVNTNSVPNSKEDTYGAVTSNGIKDMGASNSYRYANISVPNSNSGTYSVTSNGIKDMGASNSYRYVNINVPSSVTHSATYNQETFYGYKIYDLGADHNYRYFCCKARMTQGGTCVSTTSTLRTQLVFAGCKYILAAYSLRKNQDFTISSNKSDTIITLITTFSSPYTVRLQKLEVGSNATITCNGNASFNAAKIGN